MTGAHLFYLAAALIVTALLLLPLTFLIASRHTARSEPIIYLVPLEKPDRGFDVARWKATVRGMTGLPVVV